jgi:hypothetical protein
MSLYYHEELSLAQIGIAIGESETRVSRIYDSAMLNLHSRLGDPVNPRQPSIHDGANAPTDGKESIRISFPRPPT